MKMRKLNLLDRFYSALWGKCPPAAQPKGLRLPPQRGSVAAPQRPALLCAIGKRTFLSCVMACLVMGFVPLALGQTPESAQQKSAETALAKPMDFAKSVYAQALKLNADAPSSARDAAILKLASDLIDYEDLSKRALSEKWEKLTSGQQSEFSALFQRLMELSYVDKVSQKHFSKSYKVDWDKDTLAGQKAVVSCFLQHRDVETELEFSLYAADGTWKLFDILIDGASLEKTYRKKYGKVFDEKGYEGIVKEMKERIAVLEKKSAGAKKSSKK